MQMAGGEENAPVTSTLQYCSTVSTIRKRLKTLEDLLQRKLEEMGHKLDEEANERRAKDTHLRRANQQLQQGMEKTTALEKSVVEAVSQSTQMSARLQKLESIAAELREKFNKEQQMRYEAEQNVTDMQIQVQKISMKLHEVEDQLVKMESKWVITPHVKTYSRARSFSADQVLLQKPLKPYITRRFLDHGIKRKANKQEKSTTRYFIYSSSPKGSCKTKSRRSASENKSLIVDTIIKSPPAKNASENKDVFMEVPEKNIANEAVGSTLQVPRISAVKAAVEEFEKFSPGDKTKGAIPKNRSFKPPKRSLFMEEKSEETVAPAHRTIGAAWKPHHQSMAIPLSPRLVPDPTKAVEESARSSVKRCLSPSLCVARVKKLRGEESKSLLPRLRKGQKFPQKLQEGSLRSALLRATRIEDVRTIRRLATLGGGGKLLDTPVVEVSKLTPLHLATSWGRVESARALIDSGAGLEVKDWINSTPLHSAAYWGHAKMCRLLLGRGAQIKARNSNAETPLHLAAQEGHLQIVRLLVDYGLAELDAKDAAGRTPWDVAMLWRKSLVASWLSRQHALKRRFGRTQRSNSLPSNTHFEE